METNIEDDSDVDLTEMEKVLKDANVFEPNMPRQLMKCYYEALKNSKNTASEEDQTRKLNQSQEELKKLLDEDMENVENTSTQAKEKPFTPKTWSGLKNIPLEESVERNNNENVTEHILDILEENIHSSFKDATKIVFGFNEMPEDSNKTPLDIIFHELKFVSIQNDSKFLNAGTALKAKMLYAYHTKENKRKAQLARLSFYPAPLPKITSTTETFPSFSESNPSETYVCRSGRQTKRKIYNYDDADDDSLDGTNNKKVKNSEEDEWVSKSTSKSTPRSNKKPDTSEANVEINKIEPDTVENSKEKKQYTPSRRMTNSEIMKRSRLFKDGPKRTCEIMFDRLKEEEEKKAKEEKKIEIFKQKLDKLDEEKNETTDSDDIISVDDEEAVRIRVVPQIPRKLTGKKRNNSEGLSTLDPSKNPKKDIVEVQHVSDKDKEESTTRINVKKRPAIRRIIESPSSLPSTSGMPKSPTTNNVVCPICSGSFEKSKIEEHASSCGDEPVTRSSSKLTTIACNVCDKVVDFDTNYEVHVKDCIAKKREKDNLN